MGFSFELPEWSIEISDSSKPKLVWRAAVGCRDGTVVVAEEDISVHRQSAVVCLVDVFETPVQIAKLEFKQQ